MIKTRECHCQHLYIFALFQDFPRKWQVADRYYICVATAPAEFFHVGRPRIVTNYFNIIAHGLARDLHEFFLLHAERLHNCYSHICTSPFLLVYPNYML